MNSRTVLLMLAAAAAGAVLALYLYCPTICRNAVAGKASGLLQALGLSSSAADTLVSDFI